MQELSLDQIKQSALGILEYIKEVCDANSIMYYLAHGTAIGAIRHQGFIPWDDDIDIYMFRRDFLKFRTVCNRDTNCRYKLLYCQDTPSYSDSLPKVVDSNTVLVQHNKRHNQGMGVYVDVFVLDNVPEKESLRNHFYRKITFLRKVWSILDYKLWIKNAALSNNIIRVLLFPSYLIHPNFIARRIDKISQSYNEERSKLCASILHCSYGLNKETFPTDMFGDGSILSFENKQYIVPQKIDDYLRQMYDEYMALPPINKRITHHNFTAYMK